MGNVNGNLDFNLGGIFGNGMKSLEKLALYVVGILNATGAVDFHKVSTTVSTLTIGGLIAALHISTPKAAN